MKYDLVIFDLDGTLLDTLFDLTDATNRALAEAGFPAREVEEVRTFIGGGVARLIRRAVPEGTDDETVQSVLARFKAIYLANVNVRTRPCAGIAGLLRRFRDRGIHTACNSNKVDAATQLLCRAHFGDLIELALGERADIPKKPAPDGARLIMDCFGVSPARTLYVGDGDADLLTAGNAGIEAAWVTWGFRRRQELEGLQIPHAFDTAEELEAFILSD
ncbi:MAG: HAD family hydrolase [Clostridia bacterium]|nr:HAD family hydrolase [Clostridia bacterium]